jgi:hypothetical protein
MNTNFSTPRPDDVLLSLPPEHRAILDQWLDERKPYSKIRADLAKPPPTGISAQTSRSAIGRYAKRRRLILQLANNNETISQLPNPNTSLKNLLHQSALTTAVKVELPPATFQILARYYRNLTHEQFKQRTAQQRDRELELHEARLAHQRRVFEFNAARAALSALAELQQIVDDPQMDDEQKVWAARARLFGALPDNQPQPKPLNQFIQ